MARLPVVVDGAGAVPDRDVMQLQVNIDGAEAALVGSGVFVSHFLFVFVRDVTNPQATR